MALKNSCERNSPVVRWSQVSIRIKRIYDLSSPHNDEEKYMTLRYTHSLMSGRKKNVSHNMAMRVYDAPALPHFLYHKRLWCLANLLSRTFTLASPNEDREVYVKPWCLLVCLFDRESACHRLASLAHSSVVTFVLFPPWLFCPLVIAASYKKPHHI